jgi:hypothetical protein
VFDERTLVVGGGWEVRGCLLVAGLFHPSHHMAASLAFGVDEAASFLALLSVDSLGDGPWIMARGFAVTLTRSIAWTCG